MKIDSKSFYYIFLIFIGLISILLTLNILRARNVYPSKSTIKMAVNSYAEQLFSENSGRKFNRIKYNKETKLIKEKDFNITNYLSMFSFPFKINLSRSKEKGNADGKIRFKFDNKKNELSLYDVDSYKSEDFYGKLYTKIISNFGLNLNNSLEPNETLENVLDYFPVYRQININIWGDGANNKNSLKDLNKYYNKIKKAVEKLGLNLPINFKFIHYFSMPLLFPVGN